MKILLVGEYSRLHNSLKEGLIALGHDVTLIGDGDGFKNFPVDIKIYNRYQKGFPKLIKRIIYKFFNIDLNSLAIQKQIKAHRQHLVHYDIVQVINERVFKTVPAIERQLFQFIFENNAKVFLLSCGTDYLSVKYAYDKKFKYSILTPYFEGKVSKKDFQHVFTYLKPNHIDLHKYIYKNINGVIATDMDYHLPMIGHPKYLGLIPNPINTDRIPFEAPMISDKIIIFHGINTQNYYKKGNDFFEKALDYIQEKHSDKVEIITTRSIPYEAYLKHYQKAHILLDMVYAYDQGYNALEAMAAGKVVFTGAEQEWLDYYNLEKNTVAINAEPDVQQIIEQLEWLINNPEQIGIISKNARQFIEDKHHYLKIGKQYLDAWDKKNASL
ncbi:glycosyltransferase [Psychroserpens sp. SPM9]|uniref:glycosyltransferase n=1 Tax=Psychroserpens sp. SPM9 TaxID=2975598 RepID=UPI0021A40069|nr:glycosyltransferase [Psychroserpens sp. SPM9]MDG5492650.1 glycosyltransferase [Psychroserpens sp. SPM9]